MVIQSHSTKKLAKATRQILRHGLFACWTRNYGTHSSVYPILVRFQWICLWRILSFCFPILGVTLCPWDMENSANAELQPSVKWQTRTITSSEGGTFSFLYFELETIELNQLDAQRKCPFFNSMLSVLEFRFTVQVRKSHQRVLTRMQTKTHFPWYSSCNPSVKFQSTCVQNHSAFVHTRAIFRNGLPDCSWYR